MPPPLVIILRKLVSVVFILLWPFRRIWNAVFGRKKSQIGELPFHVARSAENSSADMSRVESSGVAPAAPETWRDWNDDSFGVQSKIEEYRRKKAEFAAKTDKGKGTSRTSVDSYKGTAEKDSAPEPDYFTEMQPKFKAPKKLIVGQKNQADAPVNRNLFEMRENDVIVPETATGELGDLDLDASVWGVGPGGRAANPRTTSWSDTQLENFVDESTLDAMAREQRRRERDEHHRQRLLEHERMLNEKRTASTTAGNPFK
ncbi:receptor-binding cancer antigen expressed on SiSo cells-like [Ditylenchus destructor]|nr:receptor-binding cancer antigen expressed on SiSo cells-like [Ditylenchus destructor]